MKRRKYFSKPVSMILISGILFLNLQMSVTHAGMIGTGEILDATEIRDEHNRIYYVLDQKDVREKLISLGIDPAQAQARVATLSDEEISQIADKIDTMPAGGGVLGVALTIFLVLLITDLLGFTHVFPFTNKGSAMP